MIWSIIKNVQYFLKKARDDHINAFAAQTALKELGFSDIEVTQLAAARGKPVGAYTMLTANNPVFILSGRAANDTK